MTSSPRFQPFNDSWRCERCNAVESDVGYAPAVESAVESTHYCARCEVLLMRRYQAQRTAAQLRRAMQEGTLVYLDYLLRKEVLPQPLIAKVYDFLW